MDTSIETEVRVRKRNKTLLIGSLALVLLAAAVWMVRSFFTSSINKSEILTGTVERGNIENTITASGEVLPEFEEIITSPINASIQSVALDAGSPVKSGQSVLKLDKSSSQMEYEKLKFQLESKQNDIRKLKLDLDKSFYDIKSNNDIKQLRNNSLEAALENARRLYKAGGGTKEDVEQAELNLKVSLLEKQQLENEIKSKQQTMQVEIRESEIAAEIQRNDLTELERKLKQADIVASRPGVVTWINKNIGASVREGESLARIADLSSFKVVGSISDNYLSELHIGLPAIVRINDSTVRGKIVNIYPSVQNNIVSFDVQLDDRSNKLFRPNLKVDVFLVTATSNNVLRVSNGPAFKGTSPQKVFLLNNGIANAVSVHTGMSNFDYIEIKDKLKEGDVVIISDMESFANSSKVIINN
jgi:HlyD family secretion protein